MLLRLIIRVSGSTPAVAWVTECTTDILNVTTLCMLGCRIPMVMLLLAISAV